MKTFYENMLSCILMVLSKKDFEFCMKKTKEAFPGSAAEPQVRPPNIGWFRGAS